jgi:MFS family permease
MDMLLFYPTGYVMDRFGRRWVAIPCLTVLAFGLMLIPLAQTLMLFAVVAIVTGFGNGLGAGINMTMGADFSPPDRRAEFLGVWRLIGDIGQFGGPIVLSALTALATLGTASVATGGIGLLGALIMFLFVPETLQKRVRAAPHIEAAPPPA